MMEGTYFFGEHLRWNLGWNNPNPAGAFIATLIPWMWGYGRLAAARRGSAGWPCWIVLLAELVLWFLLCKTYSRGALMAAGVAGGFWYFGQIFGGELRVAGFVRRLWGLCKCSPTAWLEMRRGCDVSLLWLAAVRLAGIALLLWLTGFLGRIDPGYVSQDASAGNRLVLWKGGLQMIATSPWKGWGAGESGAGFMQWFQPLEANEAYAGMVNSYLHVGVEYGLPVLLGVLLILGTMVILALPGRTGSARDWLGLAAGASVVAFLAANIFSTLWIFENLWWVVAVDALLIVSLGLAGHAKHYPRRAMKAASLAVLLCIFLGAGLYGGGKLLAGEVRVAIPDTRLIAVSHSGGDASIPILVIPDPSVLGNHWGKEIRRMAADPGFRDAEIFVSREPLPQSFKSPAIIIACGNRVDAGIAVSKRFPAAKLILVHPVGRPQEESAGVRSVTVLLPDLDTTGSGRVWRKACQTRGWKFRVNSGVGQDARLIWPGVLVE